MPGFAVIDLETTGFSPRQHDRIAEVAVVLTDAAGRVQDEWCTLVNPERDLGPQHVHGISAADVGLAPTFAVVAPHLARLLEGRVIVAHNASFDTRFLRAEFGRVGLPVGIDPLACLCTMRLAGTFLPSAPRGLAICCELAGVVHDGAHSALGDARATAGLLEHYLGLDDADPLWGVAHEASGTHAWPWLPTSGAFTPVLRGASRPTGHWLSGLSDRLDRVPFPPQADDYLALLDLALLDRYVSFTERGALLAAAQEAGLSRAQVESLHHGYLDALARVALLDGVLSDSEIADLHEVADQLGLDADDVAAAVGRAASGPALGALPDGGAHLGAPPAVLAGPGGDDALGRAARGAALGGAVATVAARPQFALARGDEIVLTGAMSRPREDWEREARAAGLTPWPNVTKRTRVVIAADPDSLSGKARTARRYGIPVVSESVLEELLGRVEVTGVR
ncbi:exonuclease domain-containing protein [Oerskovia jenensis]|uniref:DNA polymerase-3 subunit epsilon n=1 Tax=Oerskovia jenensis TaxID=162169 RepID=A0ABS2LF94_9CELL|nr:exonuclease domain-containing protein [Oerskovia jenensis]MBM7479090.1 DNA polymerase-3 subunit epsilon [Oerskovia jenensis]